MKYGLVLFLISISIFFQQRTFAQPQLWDIYSVSNQPFVNVTVDKYESDSLHIRCTDRLIALHQDSIKYLVKQNRSQWPLGILIGSMAGVIFANILPQQSSATPNEFGSESLTVFGALIGGTIGGVFGLAKGIDAKYQIEKLNTDEKRKLLNGLFRP